MPVFVSNLPSQGLLTDFLGHLPWWLRRLYTAIQSDACQDQTSWTEATEGIPCLTDRYKNLRKIQHSSCGKMMVKQSIGILGVDPGVVSWVGKEKRRDEILQARAKKLENFPRAFSSSDPANDCPWVDSKNEYFVAHLPCVDDANERKMLDAHQVLFACTGCLYSMSSIRLIDHWRSYFSHDIKTKLLTLTIQKLDHRINSSLYVTSAELWFWRFIYLFNREEKYDVTLPW